LHYKLGCFANQFTKTIRKPIFFAISAANRLSQAVKYKRSSRTHSVRDDFHLYLSIAIDDTQPERDTFCYLKALFRHENREIILNNSSMQV
jgi:hypothetical protein